MGGAVGFSSFEITEDPVTTEVTHSLVTERFELAHNYADQAFSVAMNAMADGAYNLDFSWDAPDLITLSDFGLSGLNPVAPDEPTINQISVDIATFTEDSPVMVPLTYTDLTPPALNYDWQSAEYDESLQSPLKAKIIDGILNGGTGLLPEVEQAIYDREKARLDVEAQNNELLALNDMASRGSRLPQGALIARLDAARHKNGLLLADVNRDVMVKSADLAYQYGTFVVEKGIVLEGQLIDLYNGNENRRLDASKFTITNLVEEFKIRVEGGNARLQADVEMNKQLIAVFTAKVERFKAQLQASETEAEVQSKIETLKLGFFDGQIKKFNSIVSAITEAYKSEVSVAVANSEMSIKHGELLSKIEIAQAEINAELIKAKGTIASQLSSAALGSVSAGASLGYSQGRSDSRGMTRHSGYSESNSFVQEERNCCNK